MAKLTFDTNRCKGCGLCVEACPKKPAGHRQGQDQPARAIIRRKLPIRKSAPAARSAQSCVPTASSKWKGEVESMAEKVLMKGNEAIAEAAIQRRLPPLFRISHHAPDGGRGLHGQAHAEDRRNLPSGGERNRRHQHGLRRGLRRAARHDLLLQPRASRSRARAFPIWRARICRRWWSTSSAAAPASAASSRPSRTTFRPPARAGHGDFHMIVLAPASVQEMADLTIKGFDLADKYRMTSMILADGTMGQMMEPVEIDTARTMQLRGQALGRDRHQNAAAGTTSSTPCSLDPRRAGADELRPLRRAIDAICENETMVRGIPHGGRSRSASSPSASPRALPRTPSPRPARRA